MSKTNKYMQIYQELAESIQNGLYKPMETLPSENELSAKYSTSRETIRKALTLLAQKGMIQKIRGKGSLVLDTPKMSFPISGLVSFKELQGEMEGPIKTHVYEFGLHTPSESLQQKLQAKETDEVWHVVRARQINGERVILDKDHFLKSHVPHLTKEICEGSIYQYLEEELGLNISFAKKEIVVEQRTKEDASLLDLHDDSHVVVVKTYVYLDDASQFQYTESRHRLDKFRFVDFARRSKSMEE
ncbi:GntR family trehalose operon transcriptional repressor [Bacillus ectoiniformans]|uniref:trehalose operon repressor n=1 Tax=Bacillus ectoiniformans TaxID=1494429 RepID=UPI00195D3DE4|nr:trehalose operon repressor [Bacillus ectoiniformans]MBM7649346.1 GntR family trehalose operon transcriptional repressor [Bacillus ectoiniformans]